MSWCNCVCHREDIGDRAHSDTCTFYCTKPNVKEGEDAPNVLIEQADVLPEE